MKFVILVFIMAIFSWRLEASSGNKFEASVESQVRYYHNLFYNFKDVTNDFSGVVTPKVRTKTGQGNFKLFGDFESLLEKYSKYTIQDHNDYGGSGGLTLFEKKPVNFDAKAKYSEFSDSSPTEYFGRMKRNNLLVTAGSLIRLSEVASVEIKAKYIDDKLTNNKLVAYKNVPTPTPTERSERVLENKSDFLNNTTMEGSLQYNNNFLPETSWFLRGTGGSTIYPNGNACENDLKNHIFSKTNSIFTLGEIGIVGRLTEKSTIDAAAGWLVRSYEELPPACRNDGTSESWSGPVFYMNFTEQVTKRDQLLAGYNYVVKNSYFSNFVLDQEIYIGLARVLGDQVLALGRISYKYMSHSQPSRREDERIAANFVLKYSISPAVKVTADLKVDLLSSDARVPAALASVIETVGDTPASYRAGSVGVGFIATY